MVFSVETSNSFVEDVIFSKGSLFKHLIQANLHRFDLVS